MSKNCLYIIVFALTILGIGVIGEIGHAIFGNYGYLLGFICAPYLCMFLTDKLIRLFILPKMPGYQPPTKESYATSNWYLYIVPLFSIIVACIHFRGYWIYKLFRILAGAQSTFYVSQLFLSQSNIKKAIAFCFFVLAIMFFPIFGIRMSREEWQIIDLFFAILS